MLVKYLALLYFITSRNYNYSLSIRKDIEFAKQFLQYYGIPDVDPCSKDRTALCPDDQVHVCSARLVRKKMEFKEFNNFCQMDLDNICEAQDSIWTIKHSGPCKMNDNLRRFAKEIEETADIYSKSTETKETNDDKTADDIDGTTTLDEATATEEYTTENETQVLDDTTDADVTSYLSKDDETIARETETKDTINENVTTIYDDETVIEETAVSEDDITDDTTISEDETTVVNEIMPAERMVDDGLMKMSKDEIGKIFFADGSVKSALREGTGKTRFPPMRGVTVWDRTKCEKRVKPCPNIYYPICLYNHKEEPNNITYYYFINLCEAQQYSCYHPERQINGSSSVRAGFCAHIQYINYARFSHTMSAWGHYGWLHGPWRFNHILKPHERA